MPLEKAIEHQLDDFSGNPLGENKSIQSRWRERLQDCAFVIVVLIITIAAALAILMSFRLLLVIMIIVLTSSY